MDFLASLGLKPVEGEAKPQEVYIPKSLVRRDLRDAHIRYTPNFSFLGLPPHKANDLAQHESFGYFAGDEFVSLSFKEVTCQGVMVFNTPPDLVPVPPATPPPNVSTRDVGIQVDIPPEPVVDEKLWCWHSNKCADRWAHFCEEHYLEWVGHKRPYGRVPHGDFSYNGKYLAVHYQVVDLVVPLPHNSYIKEGWYHSKYV